MTGPSTKAAPMPAQPVPDADPDEAVEVTAPAAAAAPPAPARRSILPWVVSGLLAVALAVTLVAWRQTAGAEAAREDVRGASIGLAISLVTWDATTLDQTAADLRDRGTGEFLALVDDVMAEASQVAAAFGASSTGEVLDVLVDVDGDAAVAIVIVRQTLTSGELSSTDEQVVRLELVHDDGRWLVDEVELINVPVPMVLDTGSEDNA